MSWQKTGTSSSESAGLIFPEFMSVQPQWRISSLSPLLPLLPTGRSCIPASSVPKHVNTLPAAVAVGDGREGEHAKEWQMETREVRMCAYLCCVQAGHRFWVNMWCGFSAQTSSFYCVVHPCCLTWPRGVCLRHPCISSVYRTASGCPDRAAATVRR